MYQALPRADVARSLCAQNPPVSLRIRVRAVALALFCGAALMATGMIAVAQTATGQFNGHVYDPNGAVVLGATVSLQDTATGLTRTTKTNEVGLYQFPLIKPGNYNLTVSATGFQTAVKTNLTLEVNQITTQDFKLLLGETTQTVSVSGSADMLEASTANLGAVVDQQTVNNLPLNGRSFSALLTLTPGENPVNYSQNKGVGYGTGFGSPGIPGSTYTFPSTQGQWNRENLYYLDGIINTAAFASSYDVPPIVDSIQEFKIMSHDDQSEYGGVLGGVVNLVTKSGTNTYHGALWEYLRNNIFDARDPFSDFKKGAASPPAPFRQNEYGADLGGPVRIPKVYNGKDKTFFFGAWEAWRYSKAVGATYVSPTAAELNGDFTNSSVVTSSGSPALLYDPFQTSGTAGAYTRPLIGTGQEPANQVGHVIPQSMIDPGVQAFLKAYSDTPNFTPTTPGGPNTILNAVGVNTAEEFTGRVDQNFGARSTLWFRYSFINGNQTQPNSQHASSVTAADDRNYGGGFTHIFSPRLIMDGDLGYSGRFNALTTAVFNNVPADGNAIFSKVQSVYGFQNFGYTSGYNGIGGNGPSENVSHELNFAVNFTWMHGNHQFRWGYEEQIPEMIQGINGKTFGSATFTFQQTETANPNNQGGTGNSLASALIGVPDNGRFQSEVNDVRTIVPSAYFEDSWKALPNLTLNLGLRWDGESSPHLLNGTTAGMLDPRTGNWIVSGGKLPPPCDPAKGVFAPCMPTLSSDPALTPAQADANAAHVVAASNPNLGPDPIYTNFGPRFGFAWQAKPNTVVRGGYALVYDNVTGSIQTVRDRLLAWPSNASLPLVFNIIGQPVTTIQSVIPTISAAKALPTVPSPFNQFGWYYDPKLKDHYSQQFNLDIQQQFGAGLLASVSYVGSLDRHLPITGVSNNSPVPGQAGANRPFPWSGTALEATSRGTSNYNAMEVRVDKRASSGLTFGTGFTWSKSMDNGSSGYYGVENGPQSYSAMQNYNDLRADYGISGNSIKLMWYGYGLYQLPFGPGQRWATHGLASQIVGGWQTNLVAQAHSGVPLGFPDAGKDPANIGNTGTYNYSRANVSGSPKLSHPTKSKAFNTSVFSHPVNQYGNSGRGMITAMPYDNFDFSLMKRFHAWESLDFQFRGELFNVFNIQNYGVPGTNYGATGFGTITSLAPGATPRQIQLSLRADF